MKKLILVAGLVALPLLGNPVSAQTFPPPAQTPQNPVTCSSQLTRTNDLMRAATDPKKKEMAMKELEMAKDKTARNDEQGCITHANAAMKALN